MNNIWMMNENLESFCLLLIANEAKQYIFSTPVCESRNESKSDDVLDMGLQISTKVYMVENGKSKSDVKLRSR